MESFKYVDIFATKGIEYLIAIAFLILLVYFWRTLNTSKSPAVVSATGDSMKISLVDWFKLADDYYYHQGHSWAMPESGKQFKIGLDDFGQKLLGTPTRIDLPELGSQVRQGKPAVWLNIEGKPIEILAPASGRVTEVNHKVLSDPALLNNDPYNSGWLFKIKTDNVQSNLNHLLKGNLARTWLQDTVDRLSMQITRNYGVVLQDGGVITNGFIKELAPDNWTSVAGDFLMTSQHAASHN